MPLSVVNCVILAQVGIYYLGIIRRNQLISIPPCELVSCINQFLIICSTSTYLKWFFHLKISIQSSSWLIKKITSFILCHNCLVPLQFLTAADGNILNQKTRSGLKMVLKSFCEFEEKCWEQHSSIWSCAWRMHQRVHIWNSILRWIQRVRHMNA